MSAIRMVFLTVAVMTFVGIWLTGFSQAHWILYVPVVLLSFAGITGICPGLIFWSKMGFENKPLSCGLAKKKV